MTQPISPHLTGVRAPAGGWRTALVRQVDHPAPSVVRLRLEVPDRVDHLPGQHYVVRLTAEDGYTASRSYSLASDPADPLIELYVERLDDGEVSTFLADVVQPGDQLQVRGPIGGWFVWDGTGPALAVGGGTGVVPLVAMLRHSINIGRPQLLQLAVSARTVEQLPYAAELMAAGATVVLSRADQALRAASRLMAQDLLELAAPAAQSDATIPAYVCGSAGFAEFASRLLVELGVPSGNVRVERFGPSGT